MPLKTLRTFDDSIQANLVKAKLESRGVLCFLKDEHSVTMNPLYINTLGGIKLQVPVEDLKEAEGIVKEMEANLTLNKEEELLTCPNCGSPELYHDFKTYGIFEWIVTMAIAFIGIVFPFMYKTVYKCKNCDTEFKNE